MSLEIKKHANNIGMTMLAIAVITLAQQLVHDEPAPKNQALDQAKLAECLPDDQGVKSILTLEQRGAGLFLHCEKHQVLSFATVAKSPVRHVSMAVPVSVE